MIKMVNVQYVRVYVMCVCKFIELYTYNYFYLYALLPVLIVHKFTNDNLTYDGHVGEGMPLYSQFVIVGFGFVHFFEVASYVQ